MAQISQNIVADQLVECIDQTLSELETCPALFVHAVSKKSFGVSRDQIPEKPEAFEEALENVFGSYSARVVMEIKKQIAQTFHLREGMICCSLPELICEILLCTSSDRDSMKLEM